MGGDYPIECFIYVTDYQLTPGRAPSAKAAFRRPARRRGWSASIECCGDQLCRRLHCPTQVTVATVVTTGTRSPK